MRLGPSFGAAAGACSSSRPVVLLATRRARNGGSAITGCGRRPMPEIRRLYDVVAAYAHSDDPLAAATNIIALCVVGNQPFYPLYVWRLVGDDGWASFATFL